MRLGVPLGYSNGHWTPQSHLTHTRARVGESHLQHPLLAITGWALPAARGALTAGNGLESNTGRFNSLG